MEWVVIPAVALVLLAWKVLRRWNREVHRMTRVEPEEADEGGPVILRFPDQYWRKAL